MKNPKNFEDVFAACLDDLESGLASPVELAARYPEYPELRELLELATDLRTLDLPDPDRSRAAEAGQRLRHAVEIANEMPLLETGASADYDDPLPSFEIVDADGSAQRRRHDRLPVTLSGVLRPARSAQEMDRVMLPIEIVDLSVGGLGLRSTAELPPGLTVEVELRVPRSADPALAIAAEDLFAALSRRSRRPRRPSIGCRHSPESERLPETRVSAPVQIVHCVPDLAGYRVGVAFVEAEFSTVND